MSTRAERRTAPPRSRATTNRRVKSEQTELNLLSTATWLFSERGFHGTGIRDIADAAGVAVSAMYYYSSSKDELLEEIMRRSLTVLGESGSQAVEGVEAAPERLALLVGSHVVFHAKNPKAAGVTDHEFNAVTGKARQQILKRRDAYEALWVETLDRRYLGRNLRRPRVYRSPGFAADDDRDRTLVQAPRPVEHCRAVGGLHDHGTVTHGCDARRGAADV